MRSLSIVAALWWVAACGQVSAQTDTTKSENVPTVKAIRVNPHPPRIDGQLDDDIWNNPQLEVARAFRQRDPDDGRPASESTLVAIAYDDHAIYVACWCYDSEPAKITRQLVRRDRDSESDNIVVRFDGYHDHQTAYAFCLNAAGVQQDWRVYNDGWSDQSWDAVWASAVKMQPWGWSAEYEIPYHCLRFEEKEEDVWGMQVSRVISRRKETDYWSYWPKNEGGFVSRFGHLTGLEGIKPSRHLEVQPYAVSSLESEPKDAGNPDGRDYYGNVGGDVKYGLSTNLTLDAAINPDFGQVELDEPVLNLTAYETYFDEKRPFFLEGADLFSTSFTLFYSRRIGRAPYHDVDDDAELYYTDYPKSTTILGAAKLTGKLAGKTSLAFLTAVTDEETAKYAAEIERSPGKIDTVIREGMVEPQAVYTVLRLQQDLFKRSHAGVMVTSVSQDTYHPNLTGGVDWRLYTNDSKWGTTGQIVFSRVDNENTGFGLDFDLNKESGHFLGTVGTTIKDVNLQINRLGYTNRNDRRSFYGWLQYRTTDDWWVVRNTWNNFNIGSAWNYASENIDKYFNFNGTVEFTNSWEFNWGYAQDFPKYDDRETRGQGAWEQPHAWNVWLGAHTDSRRSVQVSVGTDFGDSFNHPWWATNADLTVRPATNIECTLSAEYLHDYGQLKWVDNLEDDDGNVDTVLFADKDQDLVELGLTTAITFTPKLSLQASARGLLSGLNYRNPRPYVGNGKYGPLVPYDDYAYEYDYVYTALNSTVLLRWEYIPGSTLYAVWTRARSESDDSVNKLVFGRDFDRFFSYGAQNVFLLKINYWMNL